MKKKELKNLGKEEMEKQFKDLKMELMKAKSQVAAGSAKNPGQIKQFRKNIARILTIKNKEVGKKHE